MSGTTEQRNPRTLDLDLLSTRELVGRMNQEDRHVAEAVGRVLPAVAQAVDLISERLSAGGRLFYVGAGTSGRLGVLDAVECPPTFGVEAELVQGILAGGYAACYQAREGDEDDAQAGERDLLERGATGADAVVGLAASGATPYTLGALRFARRLGCVTVGISCNKDARLSSEALIAIEVEVGPEVVAGSTRLKAGTAQKMILNMISTGSMVRLGHVYSNLMVNLHTRNRKLRGRAVRMIAQVTGEDEEACRSAFEQTGQVKAAIVMLKTACSADQALRRVAETPSLRRLLQEI